MREVLKSIALFYITLIGSVMLFGIPQSFAWDPLQAGPVVPGEAADASSPVTSLSPLQIGWIVGAGVGDGYGVILHTTDGRQQLGPAGCRAGRPRRGSLRRVGRRRRARLGGRS